jgi:hypothetical protein
MLASTLASCMSMIFRRWFWPVLQQQARRGLRAPSKCLSCQNLRAGHQNAMNRYHRSFGERTYAHIPYAILGLVICKQAPSRNTLHNCAKIVKTSLFIARKREKLSNQACPWHHDPILDDGSPLEGASQGSEVPLTIFESSTETFFCSWGSTLARPRPRHGTVELACDACYYVFSTSWEMCGFRPATIALGEARFCVCETRMQLVFARISASKQERGCYEPSKHRSNSRRRHRSATAPQTDASAEGIASKACRRPWNTYFRQIEHTPSISVCVVDPGCVRLTCLHVDKRKMRLEICVSLLPSSCPPRPRPNLTRGCVADRRYGRAHALHTYQRLLKPVPGDAQLPLFGRGRSQHLVP